MPPRDGRVSRSLLGEMTTRRRAVDGRRRNRDVYLSWTFERIPHRQLRRRGDLDDEPDEQRDRGAHQQNARREGKHHEQRQP